MEKLANITETDIKNGVLNRMLANAGIPDVPEYVKNFHQETEDLIIEKFENHTPSTVHNDEQVVPPADIQHWITGFRPRVEDPIEPSLPKQQQQQQKIPADVQGRVAGIRTGFNDSVEITSTEQQSTQLPADVQSWITGLRLRLDDPVQPPLPEQQQQKPPTDLRNWMQSMVPHESHPPNHSTTSETVTTTDNIAPVDGNLGIWLTDWSKHIAEQPLPTSLDTWLQSLVPENMHELIGKTNTSKARLNNYLNAAQDVLSKHGYNVSNEITPTANVKTKTGVFGNVKHMYFLWKVLDKNHDRQITVEDVQIMLQEQGFGFLSKQVAQSLFEMVDSNHDGKLQFRDCIALMGIIKQLVGAVGSAKAQK